MTNQEELDPYTEYLMNLNAATSRVQVALNILDGPNGIKRSLWYRMSLLKVESDLRRIVNQELNKYAEKK